MNSRRSGNIVRCLFTGLLFLLSSSTFANALDGLGLGGYACNVANTPNESYRWSINLFKPGAPEVDSEVVFGVTQNRKIQSVACTPDGKEMIFSLRETTQGDFEIYSLDLLTNEVFKLTDNDTDDVDVSMSEDGSVMAWQKRLADGRQAINIRTYGVGQAHTDKTLASANPFVQPSLSANGKWLALVQMRKSNFLAIRYDVVNNAYKTIHSIPRRKRLYHPSVSSDGNIFGWVENKKQTRYLVKNIEENTTNKLIIGTPGIEHPYISQNGEWVSYSVGEQAFLKNIASGLTEEIGSSDRLLSSYWMGDVGLVGSWHMANGQAVIFHFLPDGRYLAIQWGDLEFGDGGFEYGTYSATDGNITFETRANHDGDSLTCNEDQHVLCDGSGGINPGMWQYAFNDDDQLVFSNEGGSFAFDKAAETDSPIDGLWEDRSKQQLIYFANGSLDGTGDFINITYEPDFNSGIEVVQMGPYVFTNNGAEFHVDVDRTYGVYGLDCTGNCDQFTVPFSIINDQLAIILPEDNTRLYLDPVFGTVAPANTATLIAQKDYAVDVAANQNYGVEIEDDFRTDIQTVRPSTYTEASAFKISFTVDESSMLSKASAGSNAKLETRLTARYDDPESDYLGLEVYLKLRYDGDNLYARYIMSRCLDDGCNNEVYLSNSVPLSGEFIGNHSLEMVYDQASDSFVFSIDDEEIASMPLSDFTQHEDVIAAGGYTFDPSHFNRARFRVDVFDIADQGDSGLVKVHLDKLYIDGGVYDDFAGGLFDNRKWEYRAEDR